jgi:K+-sensing histidine kinase KdpD
MRKGWTVLALLKTNRPRVMFALALVAPLCVAAILVPFRGTFANAAAGLVLVAVIVAVAVGGSRASGCVASVSAAVWFDFFLTKPYDQFVISQRPEIETTTSLLIVGLLVTELAARGRHFHRVSSEESSYLAMASSLTEFAKVGAPSALVIERANEILQQLLDLRACRFEFQPSDPPMAQILASGEIVHVDMLWPAEELGIPGPETEIPSQWQGRFLGRFVLTPTPGQPIALDRRVVAVLLASVVAASLATETRVP